MFNNLQLVAEKQVFTLYIFSVIKVYYKVSLISHCNGFYYMFVTDIAWRHSLPNVLLRNLKYIFKKLISVFLWIEFCIKIYYQNKIYQTAYSWYQDSWYRHTCATPVLHSHNYKSHTTLG